MCTKAILASEAIPAFDYYIRYGARTVEIPLFTADWIDSTYTSEDLYAVCGAFRYMVYNATDGVLDDTLDEAERYRADIFTNVGPAGAHL